MKTELELKSGCWILIISPRRLNFLAMSLIARLGEGGLVRVLDGGNCFDAYDLARKARGKPEILKRVTVSRAFTCYQVLSLLESTPADDAPFVVLDMLRTFYDESVPLGERRRLLGECVSNLGRLTGSSATRVPQGCSAIAEAANDGMKPPRLAGGLISIYPPAVHSVEAIQMCEMVQASTAEYVAIDPIPDTVGQIRLF